VIGNVRLEPNSSVWFGAILRGDIEPITVGRGSNVQDGSVLHTDPGRPLTIGKNVTIGHMAMLHGCTVGDNSLIGIGTTIMNGARIGADSIVGAHSLITEEKIFPNGVLIIGTPGQVVRELRSAEINALANSAARYTEKAIEYLSTLQPA
ncbi:uncharacterized protein METZ01_LOCUS167486, partial [marine metagenome]